MGSINISLTPLVDYKTFRSSCTSSFSCTLSMSTFIVASPPLPSLCPHLIETSPLPQSLCTRPCLVGIISLLSMNHIISFFVPLLACSGHCYTALYQRFPKSYLGIGNAVSFCRSRNWGWGRCSDGTALSEGLGRPGASSVGLPEPKRSPILHSKSHNCRPPKPF